MKTLFTYLFVLLAVGLLSAGCVVEHHREPCARSVRFHYGLDGSGSTSGSSGSTLTSEGVNQMRIYAFDHSTGELIQVIKLNEDDVERGYSDASLPDGTYDLVVWASNALTSLSDVFSDVQKEGNDPDGYHTAEVLSTKFSDFRMMLAWEDCDPDKAGDVTPRTADFADLYYANAMDVRVTNGQIRRVYFDFVRNTKIIDVRVIGLGGDYLPAEIFILSRGGVQTADNSTDDNSKLVRYEPYSQSHNGDDIEQALIKIMRFEVADVKPDSESVMLYVRHGDPAANTFPPINVIEHIINTRDGNGNAIYSTQRAIDRQDAFVIELTLGKDSNVSVKVNGFTTQKLEPITR